MLISNVSLAGLIVIFSVLWNCNFSIAIIASVYAATAAESHKCDQMWRWAHPAFGFSHRQKSSTAIRRARYSRVARAWLRARWQPLSCRSDLNQQLVVARGGITAVDSMTAAGAEGRGR